MRAAAAAPLAPCLPRRVSAPAGRAGRVAPRPAAGAARAPAALRSGKTASSAERRLYALEKRPPRAGAQCAARQALVRGARRGRGRAGGAHAEDGRTAKLTVRLVHAPSPRTSPCCLRYHARSIHLNRLDLAHIDCNGEASGRPRAPPLPLRITTRSSMSSSGRRQAGDRQPGCRPSGSCT